MQPDEPKSADSRPGELKSIPKSSINDYPAELGRNLEIKSSLVLATSQGSGASTPSQSLDADQELIRKKIQAINSIKNRLQTQISNSGSVGNIDGKRNTGQFGSGVQVNSDSKLYGSNHEPSLGQIMKSNE